MTIDTGTIEPEWIAPESSALPDFIISGAMKCGTTSLHDLLASHPRVYIPDDEINFFDIDDVFQHADFLRYKGAGWSYPSMIRSSEALWEWYSSKFNLYAQNGQIIGEDSTCYICSKKAFKRISSQKKIIKVIVCLRQPSKRAYSQYWHLVRTGRALHSFEDTIRLYPWMVLERSMFAEQIRSLLNFIDKSNVHFVVLEDFLDNRVERIGELSRFIGIDPSLFPPSAASTHANSAMVPKNLSMRLLFNRLVGAKSENKYALDMPHLKHAGAPLHSNNFTQILTKVHGKLNPLTSRRPPDMNPETRRFLDNVFLRENKGLSELIGIDTEQLWFR